MKRRDGVENVGLVMVCPFSFFRPRFDFLVAGRERF